MSEVLVKYQELHNALLTMQQLEAGIGFSLHSTSELINHSSGKMCIEINDFYRELMEIENVLIAIVSDTIETIENAGIAFADLEKKLVSLYGKKISDAIQVN